MEPYVYAYIRACEAYGWEGTPTFNTRITPMVNGGEQREGMWSQPRQSFTVGFNNIPVRDYRYIREMFLNRMGRLGAFLFRDRLDDHAQNDVIAVALPGQDAFQLSRMAFIDGSPYRHNVYAIYVPDSEGSAIDAPIQITVDDIPAAGYSLDRDRGLVIFDTPMTGGEVLRWTGPFSRWVRFDTDDLPFTIDNRSGNEYITNGDITLIEVRPPLPSDSSSS